PGVDGAIRRVDPGGGGEREGAVSGANQSAAVAAIDEKWVSVRWMARPDCARGVSDDIYLASTPPTAGNRGAHHNESDSCDDSAWCTVSVPAGKSGGGSRRPRACPGPGEATGRKDTPRRNQSDGCHFQGSN